jgi:hypothetical protein
VQMVDLWTTPNIDACPPASTGDVCLNCGACCASFRVSFYWSESDEAVMNCVPPEMTWHVAPLLCAMKGTDRLDPWCVALQGSAGVSVRCSIYDRRPSVCHEVAPSGQNGMADFWCDRARSLWGLPPLGLAQAGGQEG